MERTDIRLVAFALFFTCTSGQLGGTYPAHEYEYSLRRDYLLEKELEMEGNNLTLSTNELIVDRYLQYRKYEHFQDTKDSGFPPQRPIQEVKNQIEATEVFRLLKSLPKGGNMHTHENHELSKTRLYDIVWSSSDFQYLYILPENHPSDPWKLDFFTEAPPGEGWEKVAGHPYLNRSIIQQHQHLIGILTDEAERYPSDSNLRWELMNTLWGRGSTQLIANIKIKREYIRVLYEAALEEGVQYLETRKNFGPDENLYELSLDPAYNATYGKKYLDDYGNLDIELTMNITRDFIAENPEFIGHRRIIYSTRYSSLTDVLEDMQQAISLHRAYPDHIRGFDLVAEEDAGRSHLFYMENFLKLYDSSTFQSQIPLYLHTAETNWAGDLISSDVLEDPVATAQNTYDAIVLGAKRVGHGLAYINYPYLLQELKTRNVAVEICPVSNQLLGLQADVRNHPAQHYIRQGIPVVLGADDPGSFGADYITLDWYEAFMGWGLNLVELKRLSQNALTQSTMSAAELQAALAKWTTYWDSYISTVVTEACSTNLTQNQPQFYRVIPREGALTGSTRVHVFGRNFERAVCGVVRCRFGTEESPVTYYVSNTHVICQSPPGGGAQMSVNVSVSLDGGLSYTPAETFTYKYTEITTTPFIGDTNSGRVSSPMTILFAFTFISSFLLYCK